MLLKMAPPFLDCLPGFRTGASCQKRLTGILTASYHLSTRPRAPCKSLLAVRSQLGVQIATNFPQYPWNTLRYDDPTWTNIVFNEWRDLALPPVRWQKFEDNIKADLQSRFYHFLTRPGPFDKIQERDFGANWVNFTDRDFEKACKDPWKDSDYNYESTLRLHARAKVTCHYQALFLGAWRDLQGDYPRRHCGLISANIQVGDKIVRILGVVDDKGALSFILRNVDGKKHIVIGKCRVYETIWGRERNWSDPPVHIEAFRQEEYFNII